VATYLGSPEVPPDAKYLQGVYEYLTNITDENAENDLVFMVDALDIWLQLSPRTLIERFEELNTFEVVTGADKACWPNEWDSPECQAAPPSTLPKGVYDLDEEPRWSNSGAVIGSVAAMRSLYKDLVEVFQEPERQSGTDQGVFNEFLAAGRLTIDYRSRLFWTMAFASPNDNSCFVNTPYHVDDLIPHELYPPLLYQTQTGEIPVVIHFNQDKELMEEWWGKFWWNKLDGDSDEKFRDIVLSRVEGAVVKFAGFGLKEWRDICPKEVIGI